MSPNGLQASTTKTLLLVGASGSLSALLIFAIWVMSLAAETFEHLDAVKTLGQAPMNLASEIYDRNGQKIGEFFDERRYFVSVKELPPHVTEAFLSAEDREFYKHRGVHWRSIIRAFFKNLVQLRLSQGASTISQQLVRVSFLPREKTFSRKIKEIILAIILEKHHSKEHILTLYLNKIYFGNRSYGIEAAARNYFRKSARDLTLAEAALLAAIPKSPTKYAPHKNRQKAFKRQSWVLKQMKRYKKISALSERKARSEKVQIYSHPELFATNAPYFVAAVLDELSYKIGLTDGRRHGLKIRTTLDGVLQSAIQNSVGSQLTHLNAKREISHEGLIEAVRSLAHGSKSKPFTPSGQNQSPHPEPFQDLIQGAALVFDTKTGAILAMQGGSDFKSTEFNRSLYTSRSLGNLVIPFYLAVALEQGLTLQSPIDEDLASRIAREVAPAKKAQHLLNRSLEVAPQVPLLFELLSRPLKDLEPLVLNIGHGTVLDKYRSLGLKRPPKRMSPLKGSAHYESLYSALATPLEVAKAFLPLVNGGLQLPHYLIESVTTSDGEILFKAPSQKPGRSVFQPDTSRALRNLLVQHHPESKGVFVASTVDLKDGWAVGLESNRLFVAWMGAERGMRPLGSDLVSVQNQMNHMVYAMRASQELAKHKAQHVSKPKVIN